MEQYPLNTKFLKELFNLETLINFKKSEKIFILSKFLMLPQQTNLPQCTLSSPWKTGLIE